MAEPARAAGPAYQAAEFQSRFFSAPNNFRLDAEAGTAQAVPIEIQSALKRHRGGYQDRPVLLPFNADDSQRTIWYACVPTDAMARALFAELTAFLGPSYIDVALTAREQDEADAHALPLLSSFGLRAIRFCATETKYVQQMLAQWVLYCQLLDRRPSTASYIPLTFDQLRAAFDRSLAARDEPGARAAIGGLRERFSLSAENRLFLEIRLAAAFERWEEIAGHRLLPTLVHLNLPRETYGDVLEAMYESQVRPFERASQVEDILRQFRDTLAESARPLFRTRKSSIRPAVLKAFVLQELTQDLPKGDACSELLALLPIGAFGSLDAEIRRRADSLASVDQLRPAQEAVQREEFDRAYALFWPLPDNVEVLRGLVLCAREAEDPVKARDVLDRLAAAASEVRADVEAASPGRLQKLRALSEQYRPLSPIWSDTLVRSDGETVDNYVERWRELARATAPEVVLAQPDVGAAAAGHLMNLALEQPDTFERLYPLWHELFVDRILPNFQLMPVYQALLEALRLRGRFTDAELELAHQTLMSLILGGADKSQYTKAVNEIASIFHEVRSPQVISWALDICDSLAMAPSRDPEARIRLLSAVVQACIEFRERLTDMQRALIRLLANEAHLDAPDVSARTSLPAPPPSSESLRGKLVAFYSLDAAALRRTIALLKQLHPDLKTDFSTDAVCTPRLKSLAAQADAFVFAWKCSKHAAFDCVKAVSRTNESLVMARGAGTTSLLAAAEERISMLLARPT